MTNKKSNCCNAETTPENIDPKIMGKMKKKRGKNGINGLMKKLKNY